MASRGKAAFFWIIGTVLFVIFAITLENEAGIPFALTFRVVCAGMCLYLMFKIGTDYPGQRWPRVAIAGAAIFDVALFFSPLAKLPASKGDIMFFAAPDATIMLAARAFTYPVTDVHTRAVRQQMIAGLVLALAVSAILLSILFVQ